MVRDHLGVVLGTAERLDPLGRLEMLLRPLRTRDLSVRDVADEYVLERELGLTFDRAAARTLYEFLLPEHV